VIAARKQTKGALLPVAVAARPFALDAVHVRRFGGLGSRRIGRIDHVRRRHQWPEHKCAWSVDHQQ
jgi:hypothetical protein